jgi:hypothetical protein
MEGSGPVLGPCALPNPEAEAEAEAESRRASGPRLLRAKSSSPHIDRVSTASGGGNTRGSQGHGLAYVEANPRPQCRAHATRFGQRRPPFACLDWIGCSQPHGGAAACSRLQRVASAAGSFTGGTRLQHSACGCNTVCCAAASRLCCVEADVPEGSSGGTDIGGGWIRLRCRCGPGMDSFAGQKVGKGSTRSTCRCGWRPQLSVAPRWAGDGLSCGADVGGG